MAPSLTIIHSRWQRLCRTSQQQQQQHSSHEPATAIGFAQPQYTRHRRIPPTPLLGKFFPLRKIRNCKKRQWKLIMIITTTTERARASHHRAYSRSALEPGLETYLVRLIRRLLMARGRLAKQKKKLINAIVIASNTSARLFNVLAIPRSKGLMQLIRISLPLRVGDPRTSFAAPIEAGRFFFVSSTERKKKKKTTKKKPRNDSLTHFLPQTCMQRLRRGLYLD